MFKRKSKFRIKTICKGIIKKQKKPVKARDAVRKGNDEDVDEAAITDTTENVVEELIIPRQTPIYVDYPSYIVLVNFRSECESLLEYLIVVCLLVTALLMEDNL